MIVIFIFLRVKIYLEKEIINFERNLIFVKTSIFPSAEMLIEFL